MQNSKTTGYKRFIAIIMAFSMAFSFVPSANVFAQDINYTEQFDYYVDCALNEGLVPQNIATDLDKPLTTNDLINFIAVFDSTKCGIDTTSVLNHIQPSTNSEAQMKVAAFNNLAKTSMPTQSVTDLNKPTNMDTALGMFSANAYNYIAPMSPVIYDSKNSFPVILYNFQNIPYVVYDEQVLIGLMSKVNGLSHGVQVEDIGTETPISRKQFAAFCYMFSTMSLPLDPTGKYPGGVTGDKNTDDFIASILDAAIKPGMTDDEKIKAIYDYMIYNFTHDDYSMPMITRFGIGSANPLEGTLDFVAPLMNSGSGTCDVFANTFRLLAIRMGLESNYVSGQYVNRDGTKLGHGWNQVKVDDVWYWYDVDVENTVHKKSGNPEPSYFLYKKLDKYWTSNHQWSQGNWPACDGSTQHTALLADAPNTNTSQTTNNSNSGQTNGVIAIPTASTVLIDGGNMVFDAYNINGYNYFKLRDIAYALNGTSSQFEIGFDDINNAITLTTDKHYTPSGGEMVKGSQGNKTATPTSSTIYLDGAKINLTAYNINGNNYFKLRDLGQVLDFAVGYDEASSTITIDTAIPVAAPTPVTTGSYTTAQAFKMLEAGQTKELIGFEDGDVPNTDELVRIDEPPYHSETYQCKNEHDNVYLYFHIPQEGHDVVKMVVTTGDFYGLSVGSDNLSVVTEILGEPDSIDVNEMDDLLYATYNFPTGRLFLNISDNNTILRIDYDYRNPTPATAPTPTPTSTPAPEASIDEYRQQTFELTNEERAEVGASPLILDSELSEIAQARAEALATSGVLPADHNIPGMGYPEDSIREYGYRATYISENLAMAQTPEQAIEQWLNSNDGHKENMLGQLSVGGVACPWAKMGVGCAKGSNGQYYWVQIFVQ